VTFRLADIEPPPDVFAAVMATGILSIAAANHHYRQISETMGFLASLGLVVLAALVIVTHRLAHWDLKDPDVTLRLFTFVAACAVLDTRLASQPVSVQTLGGMALVSWPAPDQPPPRNAALRRGVVGFRLPAGYVLRGQLHHGS
jgi:tellurite resistance protein TehA-like permease